MVSTREKQIYELFRTAFFYQIKHLYKYRTMEKDKDVNRLANTFTNQEIYFPSPLLFNDPFECRRRLEYSKKLHLELYLRNLIRTYDPTIDKKKRKQAIKEIKKRLHSEPDIMQRIHDGLLNKIGIYCLSAKRDDILMWSHYTNGHRGLCLEFDTSNIDLFGQALEVKYSDEYPIINIMKIRKLEEYHKLILTKSKHWEYEQEYRIIKTVRKGGPGVYTFPPELLTGVILGALISPEDRKKVLDWINQYPTKITLYEAKISDTKYELKIKPL